MVKLLMEPGRSKQTREVNTIKHAVSVHNQHTGRGRCASSYHHHQWCVHHIIGTATRFISRQLREYYIPGSHCIDGTQNETVLLPDAHSHYTEWTACGSRARVASRPARLRAGCPACASTHACPPESGYISGRCSCGVCMSQSMCCA